MNNSLTKPILRFESLISLEGPFLIEIYGMLNTNAYTGGYVFNKDKVDDSINEILDKGEGWGTKFLSSFQYLSAIASYLYYANTPNSQNKSFKIFGKHPVSEVDFSSFDYKHLMLSLYTGNKFITLGGKLYIPLKYNKGAQLLNILRIDPVSGERTVLNIAQFLRRITDTNIDGLQLFKVDVDTTNTNLQTTPLKSRGNILKFPSVEELSAMRSPIREA